MSVPCGLSWLPPARDRCFEVGVPLETSSAPEDAGGVAVDLVEEVLGIGGATGHVVLVEREVPVSPVDRPSVAGVRVVQLRDREPCPVWSVLGPPWWTALQDRDGSIGDVHLEADLVASRFRDSLLGRPPDLVERTCRDHEGSFVPGRRILIFRGSTTTTPPRRSSSGWALIRGCRHDHRGTFAGEVLLDHRVYVVTVPTRRRRLIVREVLVELESHAGSGWISSRASAAP